MPEPILPVDTTTLNNEQDPQFSEEELESLDDKTKGAIKSLSEQKKHWRNKAKELEAKAALPPTVPPPPVTSPAPQPAADMEAVTRKVLMESKRDEALSAISEDKRNAVKEIFSSLTSGKQIDSSNFGSYMEMAQRAVGIAPRSTSNHRISTNANGSVPPRTPPGPTPEEIEMARKAGNDPAKVYGKDARLDGLHNAERFNDKKEEEFN